MLTSFQKRFFYAFISVLIISFTPLKIIAAVSPFLFIFLASFMRKQLKTTVRRFCLLSICTLITYLFYKIIYHEIFISQNFVLFLITYSSFIPILLVPNDSLKSHHLLQKVLSVIFVIFVIEAFLGLLQVSYGFTKTLSFAGSTGDHVEGTIHLGLDPAGDFSNVMYAVLMSYVGLSLLAYKKLYKDKLKLILYFIGWSSIILASVVHVLLFLFIAVILAFLIIKPMFSKNIESLGNKVRKGRKYLIAGIIILLAFSSIFIGQNIALVGSYFQKITTVSENFPKTAITLDAIRKLPDENILIPIVGLGPGQFTSRASLMSTGMYLGTNQNPITPPFISVQWNPMAEKYLKPQLIRSEQLGPMFGSTKKPHYSLLTIYTEFGILGLSIIIGFMIYLIRNIIIRSGYDRQTKIIRFIILCGILLLAFLSLQENYWEITQAIFPGLLLMKLLYANMSNICSKKISLIKKFPEDSI